MKKKIILAQKDSIINGTGGAEKVLVNMANEFHNRGYEIIVATNDKAKGELFFDLNTKIKFINIFNLYNPYKKTLKSRLIKLLPKKFRPSLEFEYFRKLKHESNKWQKFIESEKPDLVIPFSIYTALEMTYGYSPEIPHVVTVHGRPDNDFTNRLWTKPDYENKELKNTYKKINTIQVLTKKYLNFIPDDFKGNKVVIENVAPAISEENTANLLLKKDKNIIVNVASIDFHHKQQDFLIKSFASITDKYPEWELHLYGKGHQEENMEKLISSLEVNKRILYKGSSKNIPQILANADIFAFPSKFEGWPIALAEAMAVGLPSLGLNSCDGVNEMIINNKNGLLANDFSDFTGKLKELMISVELRQILGKQAHEDMKQFSGKIIWDKWEKVLNE